MDRRPFSDGRQVALSKTAKDHERDNGNGNEPLPEHEFLRILALEAGLESQVISARVAVGDVSAPIIERGYHRTLGKIGRARGCTCLYCRSASQDFQNGAHDEFLNNPRCHGAEQRIGRRCSSCGRLSLAASSCRADRFSVIKALARSHRIAMLTTN